MKTMTRHFSTFKRSPQRGGFSRGNGRSSSPRGSFRSGRKINTIDKSLLVKKALIGQEAAPYESKHTFADFQVNDLLKQNIIARGYMTPTPIQDQAIPHVLEGKDVVGVANTGTGKTAAFLVPLLNKIYFKRNERALIIAPTRELAVQIQDECRLFSKGMNIYSQLCIGGVGMYPQIAGLKRQPHVVIGTPGRLKDLSEQRHLHFDQYTTIILDEVDRMLDMGFIKDIKFIISKLPSPRQSLFFSATISPEVRSVMEAFLHNPVTISVKTQPTAHNVDQDIVKTNGRLKQDVLYELLKKEGFAKVLVFGRTKWGIEKLAKQLSTQGISVAAIHGNKNQNQRQRALDQFKNNKVNVLLATDVASRGLDITDVTHVINYDLPESYDDYVHRIGRTGRANKKGIALSFVD